MRTHQGWVLGGSDGRRLHECQMQPAVCELVSGDICFRLYAKRPQTDRLTLPPSRNNTLLRASELRTPTKLRRRFCACQCYTLLKLLSYFQEEAKKMHWSSCYLSSHTMAKFPIGAGCKFACQSSFMICYVCWPCFCSCCLCLVWTFCNKLRCSKYMRCSDQYTANASIDWSARGYIY